MVTIISFHAAFACACAMRGWGKVGGAEILIKAHQDPLEASL